MDRNDTTPKERPRGVLWDLDGTIIDSRQYHFWAWRDTLRSEGCEKLSDEIWRLFGQNNATTLRQLFGQGISDDQVARISAAKEERYRTFIRTHGVQLLGGVLKWLSWFSDNGWRQAIASSAPRMNIELILSTLAIEDYFDAVVGEEDVAHGKPNPQVFLTAAARINLPPQRCIVIEDSPAGIEAAKRAGIAVIGIRSDGQGVNADVVIPHLDMLNTAILSLLDKQPQ